MRPAAAEIPVNPNRPATNEITKKISAHLSMVSPNKIHDRLDLSEWFDVAFLQSSVRFG